ncbi:vacuolar protein sorting-associated protein 13-like [Pistacia vera]|uniref:vacuolar protein sorting-associated protein 13-like n=1 Tax=Pistacia vera TaxID=55513 RepID=UPI00126315D7|nr:vacuolar protein sorting-associated protein 13-like [Pistacia vera]
MSLGADHCWGWLCDIRNPGVESLIKFKFDSYNAEDDDYDGYDYSLSGRLSGVRIVFLYRFVQEISAYFMELATPHSEEVIKLVDKVGGFEWLIKKYEMDGATALKLDLSLDTPIIIVPRNSLSKDFIQLDLGHLKVTNEINWHGSSEKDPSAVHIDVLHAEIMGINMSVGINGSVGKPMIQDGQGLDIFVRRSLRDVFRKVPTFSLEVKVGSLHGVMSDKEYDVILNCTFMNLNEAPNLPPSFRGSKSDSNDTMRLLVHKFNLNSQMLLSHSVTIIAVEVDYALLELCTGIIEESPLAHVALEGLWVSYRMTSSSEIDLYVTIPKFSIMDIRPSTKPEMRLMLGSSTDASKQPSSGKSPLFLNEGSFKRPNSEVGLDIDVPVSTMFLMDYRWRASSQSYVVWVQQPRVLVVPDFLLAIGEFFVPALGAIIGRDETMDPKNDPISRNNSIVLSGPVYTQSEDVVHLSPGRQLIADAVGVDEYTYDGCGKIICLSEEKHMKDFQLAKY